MRCMFCGSEENVVPVKLPKTFTSYQYLQAGEGACPQCLSMLRDERVRRNSWVWDGSGIRVIQDPLSVLVDPPEPPFRIYLTRTRKKHGWIRLMNRVSYSRERFWVGFDESLILVDRRKAESMVELARSLRARGLSKSELRRGPSVRNFEKLSDSERKALKEYAGDPLWEVIVSFV